MRSRSKFSNNSTFYVDVTNGNDANNGKSAGTAWKTISKVNASVFNAGSLILFLGGASISGAVALTNTNCPLGNVTLSSYGTGQATILSTSSAAITATNVPGITVDGLICTGSGNLVNATAGISFVNSQAGNTKLAGPTISNVTVSGYGGNGIEIKGASGTSGFKGISFNGTVLVHDCTGNLINNGSGGTAGINIFSEAGYGTNSVHQNVNINGAIQLYNITGTPGATHWTGAGFIVGETSGLWTGSSGSFLVHDFAYNHTAAASDPVGIMAYDSDNIHFRFFEVYNGRAGSGGLAPDGIDLDGGCTNSSFSYGKVHDNTGYGILVDSYNDGTVTTWNNNSMSFILSQNNTLGEIQIGAFSTMTNLAIFNITAYSAVNAPLLGTASSAVTLTGTIANCIFRQGVSSANLITMPQPGSLVLAGNDYFGSTKFSWSGSSYASFAAWQTATGQEKIAGVNVGLTSDPQIYVPGGLFPTSGYLPLQDMANNLQSGSPMVGTGVNILTNFSIDPGTQDYYGTAVTASTLPVGAAAGDISAFTSTSTASSTFLARVSSFTNADKVNYDSLLTGMNLDGDLALVDALYILAAPNSAASLLNLVSTSFSLVAHGTTTFAARSGIHGNGTTGYLDTGFTPPGTNFLQNSASIAVYNLTTTAPTVDHVLLGNAGSAMYNDISVQTSAGTFAAVNEGGAFSGFSIGQGNTPPNGSAGYLFAQRTGAALAHGYYNGASSGTGTTEASGALTSAMTITLLANNPSPGPVASFSTETVSAALMGGGGISPSRTGRRINSFMTAYGINTY